jgi:anti-anti-sigma factor
MLTVESRSAGEGVVQVRVSGEIDMVTVGSLGDALQVVVTDSDVARIVVDFTGVSFCDSSGIRVLDAAYAVASRRGIAFELVNLQPSVRHVFEIVGVLDALTKPAAGPLPDGRDAG